MTNQTHLQLEGAIDERAAADFLNVSVKTIQGWRQKKTGPRFYRLSNRVRYLPADLRQYLAACAVEPASAEGAR